MRWLCVLALVLTSPLARAQGNVEPSAATDAQLEKLAGQETIEIFDERPDKPFDRDTEVRLTGEQLAARGATDLGTALALLPDVTVRDAGRGGFNIDIRGARKGAVSILVDGVLVTDPYYGTFDVSTIPITDIVQIRVATTPQSPIDGPGGPGGVIEVHTRDAIGPQLVIARLTADSLPSLGVSGTARVALADHLALRISASGLGGVRDLALPPGTTVTLGEDRHAATGSTRLEYRTATVRVAADGFLDDRHYISPPSDVSTSSILMIDRETTERGTVKADEQVDKLQLQQQLWVDHLHRLSRYFSDPSLANQQQIEDLLALRTGGMALATRPIGKSARWAASATIEHETVDVSALTTRTNAALTLAELAGDAQYEYTTVRVDAAAGLALPFVDTGASPWPEGKLTARWRPSYGHLELEATLARKGRVPSLRERFDPAQGNPSLGPEMIDDAEIRAIENLGDRARVEIAPFYKYSTGTIRASTNPADMGKLVNLGALDYYGIDALARVQVHPLAEVGGAYDYIRVTQLAAGGSPEVADPLDRLPHSRAEAWVQATPQPGYAVLARVRYYGEAIDRSGGVCAAPPCYTAAYTIVEATATAQLSPQYLAVLRVDDVFNVRPETRAGYHTAGRVISFVLQGQWP
jgi:outer membrane receptor protein involved in Fe transport